MSSQTLSAFLLSIGIFFLLLKLEGMESAEICHRNSSCQECTSLQNAGPKCHFFVVVGKTRGFFCASEDFEWPEVEGSVLFSRVTENQTCPNLRGALNVPFLFPASTAASEFPMVTSTLEHGYMVNETTEIYPAQKNETEMKTLDTNFSTGGSIPIAFILCVMFLQAVCFLFCFRAVVQKCFRKYLCT